MENIPKLREICQTTAKKDVSNVYMRYVSRFFSIYFTRLLIPTKVHPDHVSFAMIVMGVIANLLFLNEGVTSFLWGALGLQVWYILDCMDGELARYRKYEQSKSVVVEKTQMGMTGSYWDYLNHYIVHGLAPICVSYGLSLATGNIRWILFGILGSISQVMLLAVHDTKSRAFMGKISKLGLNGAVRTKQTTGGDNHADKSSPGLIKKIFMGMHYSCTYPTVMNLMVVLFILSALFDAGDSRALFLIYHALASFIVFIAIASKNLRNRGVDQQFDEQFIFSEDS